MNDTKGLFMTYKGLYLISKNGIIIVTLFVAGGEIFRIDSDI
jgi:hypothetical protein